MKIPTSQPSIGPSALKYITKAIKANEIAQGPYVQLLERNFSKYTGFMHSLACSNGTTALFLALRALGIEDGEVIMPSLAFAAVADAVLMAGAKPVFVDITEMFDLDRDSVAERITKNTRAIISVDTYGVITDVKNLRQFNLPIIRDACESLGNTSNKDADLTVYSFFGNKVMTTGEGGMVCTDDLALAEKIKKLRNHGRVSGYIHEYRGTNARMSNITAALGVSQLEDLPKNLRARTKIFNWYGFPVNKPIAPWFAIARVEDKEKTVWVLKQNGIEARVGFYALHKMEPYRQKVSLPITDKMAGVLIMLPCYPGMTKQQVDYIKKHL